MKLLEISAIMTSIQTYLTKPDSMQKRGVPQLYTIPAWYPMRVTYGREVKVKEYLDSLHIENFLPMHYELVDPGDGNKKRMLVPAVRNLIFVHGSRAEITSLKTTRRELQPLRYITKHFAESKADNLLTVPDAQMQNFMRVASVQDESVMFLDSGDYLNKVGRRVLITEGYFAGVEGVIKRIKKNKHVVVQLEGLTAVAITYVPASCLKELGE